MAFVCLSKQADKSLMFYQGGGTPAPPSFLFFFLPPLIDSIEEASRTFIGRFSLPDFKLVILKNFSWLTIRLSYNIHFDQMKYLAEGTIIN